MPQSCFVASIPSKVSTQCLSERSCFWITHQCWVSDLFNDLAMRRLNSLSMERHHCLLYLLFDLCCPLLCLLSSILLDLFRSQSTFLRTVMAESILVVSQLLGKRAIA